MPEITVEAITKTYGADRALNVVSFTVRDGELLTLLGPSGCGKTTTLMSIAGFERPDAGRIICDGQAFFDHSAGVYLPAENRNLGIVFQSYAVWPHMTVAQNVGFGLKVRKHGRAEINRRVSETLELVELGSYGARYPHELSGGQQQRVALARALVYSPSVLLLDEPFSNLDAKLRERTRTWLKQLQAELALTTVFVTHDQDEALSMSDRIIVMNRGEILQTGTPEDVYRRPSSRFVAEFLGQCNILTGRVAAAGPNGVPEIQIVGGTDADNGHADTALVDVAVRPEAIELSGRPSSDPNSFAMVVSAASFLGDHYLYELEGDGLSLIATSPRRFDADRLTARIPADACRVLSDAHADPAPVDPHPRPTVMNT
jgi:iron(III) transport system ATP-binding protein